MSDVERLCTVVSGGFLFLGGIFLNGIWGDVLLGLGLVLLVLPLPWVARFLRWAFAPTPKDKD